MPSSDALLLVDPQVDFFPGGALGVPHGDEILPVANRLIDLFVAAGLPIVATRDWHPADHCSFRDQGGSWPRHCVADTPGAAFHPDLRLPDEALVIDKATRPRPDAYSGFQRTGLAERLRGLNVRRVVVCGLATDYCVKASVLDARREGFDVDVVTDGIRGVDVHPGDSADARAEMERAGARLLRSDECIAHKPTR